jgi:hypothetical protein
MKYDLVVIEDNKEIVRKSAQQFYKEFLNNKLEVENLQYTGQEKIY